MDIIYSDHCKKRINKIKRLEDVDVKQVIDIFKENIMIELTAIKDKFLANKIKEEIISNF